MDRMWESITSIAVAIVGIAMVAVLVSGQAQTGKVISAATGGFAQDLEAAVSPVAGGGGTFNFGGGATQTSFL